MKKTDVDWKGIAHCWETLVKENQKQAEILRILKENADTSVERTDFIDGEEYEYTATVIEIANDGGIDYKIIKKWLEDKE